ncbi:VWA domain-containing protein [Motiliproteus sp. MSK22-1]|uniref:vWA domain-containing protein n=1 Tax=Motiliproteus sp. MSK22-1 TaxID=1897630 RepID=UPI00097803E8|nr:VWA domain-containing protein [Motiliproteus sp. MSK22-1]OMH33679.1 hypothetical protein BGP75_11775 [Motiliproteus sp. MSK22-1]
MIEQFHFLRPLWLAALLPVCVLVWGLWSAGNKSQWADLIKPELLSHLLDKHQVVSSRWPLAGVFAVWVIATIALAGPAWEKLPQPLYKKQSAVVLILDLSPSMLAQDMKPARIVHARHRLIDLLKSRQEGVAGLVVYAGDAHVLAPLSSDRETLLALIPSLDPSLMPVRGSRAEDAVATAMKLLTDAGHNNGDLVLITDGVAANARYEIQQKLAASNFRLSILGVGTSEGAPVPLSDGSYAKDRSGNIHLARLNSLELQQLATNLNGLYQDLKTDGSDTELLLQFLDQSDALLPSSDNNQLIEREFDLWNDAGSWLVLLLLPLVLLSHRRGWLLVVLIVPLVNPQPVYAFEWQDLWKNKNQQAIEAFEKGEHARAAELFDLPEWKGSAQYKSGDYQQAAESFAADKSADSWFNRGNALAKAGQLEEAVSAFEQALKVDPQMEDALFG